MHQYNVTFEKNISRALLLQLRPPLAPKQAGNHFAKTLKLVKTVIYCDHWNKSTTGHTQKISSLDVHFMVIKHWSNSIIRFVFTLTWQTYKLVSFVGSALHLWIKVGCERAPLASLLLPRPPKMTEKNERDLRFEGDVIQSGHRPATAGSFKNDFFPNPDFSSLLRVQQAHQWLDLLYRSAQL